MGETTLLIQRRMRHWKTTLTGLACLLAPVAAAVWPEYAPKITAGVSALAGLGFIAAADASKTAPPPPTQLK